MDIKSQYNGCNTMDGPVCQPWLTVLANRFQVFLTPIALAPQIVEVIVLATCALYNYMQDQSVSTNVGDVDDTVTHDIIPGA